MKQKKLRVLAGTAGILAITLVPALGALFQLGAGLAGIEAMHRRAATEGAPRTLEQVGTYVDEPREESGLRLHTAMVIRGD